MISVRFDTEALMRVRFAISPMLETVRSVTALDDPAACALHLPWAEEAGARTASLDLSVLRALQCSHVYNPDFVNPPPSSPLADLEEELGVMVATPAAQIRREVARAYEGRTMPPVLEPFLSEPRRAIRRLADLLRAYWDLSLAAHWPRIHSLLEHDVLHRARQMADGGTRRLFADLDPGVSWEAGVLQIQCSDDCATSTLDLDERGLLLVPSVFVWPKVTVVSAPPWQPTVIYPARGIGMLWSPQPPAPPDALAKLVGGTRATLLAALDSPRSTTDLARSLGVSVGGVSQQLSILREAGLARAHRVQRVVLYMRSSEGDALMSAVAPAAAPAPADAGDRARVSG